MLLRTTHMRMHARYHQRTTKYVTNSIFPKPSIRLVDHRQAAHEFSRGFVIMHRFFFAMSHTISPITCHSFFLQLARCMSVFKSERSESSLQNSEKRVIPGVPTTLVHEFCKESLNVKRGEKLVKVCLHSG